MNDEKKVIDEKPNDGCTVMGVSVDDIPTMKSIIGEYFVAAYKTVDMKIREYMINNNITEDEMKINGQRVMSIGKDEFYYKNDRIVGIEIQPTKITVYN